MRLIVISSDHPSNEEANWVNKLFTEGLMEYHLKKKSISRKDSKNFIENIEYQYHNRIILHQHYSLVKKFNLGGIHVNRKLRKSGLSGWIQMLKFRLLYRGKKLYATCHRLSSLNSHYKKYDAIIYGPLYKMGLSGRMEPTLNPNVTSKLSVFSKADIFAMGGISSENIAAVKHFGFNGVAIVSGIWNQDKNPLDAFKEIKESLR
ncbi:MAG: thiamine phosphate synthase [Flavobacteriales bacterium]